MGHEQLNDVHKAQISQWFDFAERNLEDAQKLLEMHLTACREVLQAVARGCQSACDIRDIPGVFHWQTGIMRPFAEQSAQYGSRLMGLFTGTGQEFSRAFEHQWLAAMRQFNGGWIDTMPVASETNPEAALDYLRDTMAAFDSVWAPARQNLQQAQKAALALATAPKSSADRNRGRQKIT